MEPRERANCFDLAMVGEDRVSTWSAASKCHENQAKRAISGVYKNGRSSSRVDALKAARSGYASRRERPGVVAIVGPNIGGKYRILSELGRGPMGIVYEAVHLTLGHRVAIKLIVEEKTAADPEAVSRLLRQARAAANLRSEHVAHVYDLDITKEQLPYVVMELLEGDDLANVLKTEEAKALPMEEAVRYGIQICSAIAEAHAYGIVHGNLKAENVFLQARRGVSPIVKVLDFGTPPTAEEKGDVDAENDGGDGREKDVVAIVAILRQMIATSQMKAPASLEAVLSREGRKKAVGLAEELLPFAPPGLEELVVEMIATSSMSSIKTTSSSSSIDTVPSDAVAGPLTSTTSRLRHFLGPQSSLGAASSGAAAVAKTWGKKEWLLAAVFGVLLLFAGMGVSAMFR
jgi:serine/threonine protein kinase